MAVCNFYLENNSEEWKRRRRIILSLKVANLLLGVIIVVLGYHSFFNSTWTKDVDMENLLPEPRIIKAHHMCSEENWNYIKKTYWNDNWPVSCGKYGRKCQGTCPSIGLEICFLAIASAWLVLTLINLGIVLLCDKIWRISIKYMLDYIYNMASFVVLLVGGIFYMAAAAAIDSVLAKLIKEVGKKDDSIPAFLKDTGSFLSGEKYAAGSLMIVQSSLHLILSVCVGLLRKYLI